MRSPRSIFLLGSAQSGSWVKGKGSMAHSARKGSAVDLSPVADAKHAHHDALVLDVADDAPVAHTVLPVAAEPGAREGFTEAAGILQWREAISQKNQ